MATHFICQSSEPLPHNYPTGLASKTHGAVSQYELYNSGNKPHTTFPPPGWDFSQTSEEDSLPLLKPAPQPESKNSSLHFDPDLCITPQKSKVTSIGGSDLNRHKFEPDLDLALTPLHNVNTCNVNNNRNDKKKQKVRFDFEDSIASSTDASTGPVSRQEPRITYSSKPYQPELYGEKDVEEIPDEQQVNQANSKTDFARTVKYNQVEASDKLSSADFVSSTEKTSSSVDSNVQKLKASGQAPSVSVSKPAKTISSGKSSTKSVKVVRETPGLGAVFQPPSASDPNRPIAISKMPEGKKRPVKVLRENQYLPTETEYSFPFDTNIDEFTGGDEHMLARPEYNSTLRMKLAAEQLRDSEVDIETALHRKLRVSGSTKAEINEKAASMVNTDGDAFSGLVRLNMPVDEMCKDALEAKTARAKQVKVSKSRSKGTEPDVMEFYSADLRQKESVTFSLPGIPAPSEQLSTASNWRAFDLYKHNRVWDSRTHYK